MKTHIITLFCAVLITVSALGQGYYSAGTIQGENFEFRCDYRSPYIETQVVLYNVENPFTNMRRQYKDGSKLDETKGAEYLDDFETKWNEQQRIISQVFTAGQKESMRASQDKLVIYIYIYISSATGRIVAVDFRFNTLSVYGQVPPATYYQIEQRLKAGVHFNISADGAKRNYCWSYVEYRGE